jgi:hypothetical protein
MCMKGMESTGTSSGFCYAGPMSYLVKAVSASGVVTWLTEPDIDGVRCVSIRERAESFQTAEDAKRAIAKIPDAFAIAGIEFSVVEVD